MLGLVTDEKFSEARYNAKHTFPQVEAALEVLTSELLVVVDDKLLLCAKFNDELGDRVRSSLELLRPCLKETIEFANLSSEIVTKLTFLTFNPLRSGGKTALRSSLLSYESTLAFVSCHCTRSIISFVSTGAERFDPMR